MTIFKSLRNAAEIIFYYLILFTIAVANVFISIAMVTRGNKAVSNNREPLSGSEGMVIGSAN